MDLLAEFGPLVQRIERAITSLGEIGRGARRPVGRWQRTLPCLVPRRPTRPPQTIGSFAAIWDHILPPVPEPIWRETLTELGRQLSADDESNHG